MPTPLRRLIAHWPLKVASLALAVLLWALVSAEQSTMHWISVPVEPEIRDPRYVLTQGPGPEEVRVLFAGRGRVLWQLALDRPRLVLPVHEIGRGGYALDAGMLRFPEGIRGVTVREIRPAVVRMSVQHLETREVAVEARFSAASRRRFLLRGAPTVSPATVRLTGPADDLARLSALETVPVQLGAGDSLGFDVRVRLDTSGLATFSFSPATVRVRGEVDTRAERLLRGVPIRDAAGALLGTVELQLSGPAHAVRAVDSLAVRVEVATPGDPRIIGLPASIQGTVVRRTPVDTLPGGAP